LRDSHGQANTQTVEYDAQKKNKYILRGGEKDEAKELHQTRCRGFSVTSQEYKAGASKTKQGGGKKGKTQKRQVEKVGPGTGWKRNQRVLHVGGWG